MGNDTPGQLIVYNKEAATSSIIKIGIPPSAVTAAALAGSITYTATNTTINVLSSATSLSISGLGLIAAKTTALLASPVAGAAISIATDAAATTAKETIKSKAMLTSLATSSIAAATAALTVTALSYAASATSFVITSAYDYTSSTLHNWARAPEHINVETNISPNFVQPDIEYIESDDKIEQVHALQSEPTTHNGI
jgi:hypothetical protein